MITPPTAKPQPIVQAVALAANRKLDDARMFSAGPPPKVGMSRAARLGIALLVGSGLLGLGYYLAIRSLDKESPTAVASRSSGGGDTIAKAVETQSIVPAVEPSPSKLASKVPSKPVDRVKPAVAQGLHAMYDAADGIDWQPTNAENIEKIEALIHETAQARSKNLSSQELEEIEVKLSQRRWTNEGHARKLNAHAVETLTSGGRAVMFFGYVGSISLSEPQRFFVQLNGRGFDVEVVGTEELKVPVRMGEYVLVLGVEAQKNTELDVHRISASVVARGKPTGVTPWTPLQSCADYLRFDRKFGLLQATLRSHAAKFSAIEPNPETLTSRSRHQLTLNTAGAGFDAVQVPGSTRSPDDDLALMFVAPPESIVDWGIVSVEGTIPTGFSASYELTNYAPPSATWPKDHVCRFQVLRGTALKNSRKHLLWFRFKNDAPVPMHFCAAYQLAGKLDGGHNSLMQQLAYEPAEPTSIRELKQIAINVHGRQAMPRRGLNGEQIDSVARPGVPVAVGPSGTATRNGATDGPKKSGGPKVDLARIELPGFRPEDLAKSIVVTPLPKPEQAKLELINPDVPQYSQIASYELAPTGNAKEGWSIQSVNKRGERKTVARLFADSAGLNFRWEAGIERADGGALRNCLLRIGGGGQDRVVVLRRLTKLDPLVVDFKKDLDRVSLGDDLPGEAGINLIVDGMDSVPTGSTITESNAQFRTATFIVLKAAESNIPGVRLRLVLWKNGLKNELILRPELTPVTSQQNLAFLKSTASKAKAGAQSSNSNDENDDKEMDPTASSNSRYLTFSIKGLGTAKTMISNQLKMVREQILIDDRLIEAKEAQLSNMSGLFVGTAAEIAAVRAKVALLRNEISALRNELVRLNAAVPSLVAQLEAFPPLEKLGNSLHLKSTLRFRVVYQAGDYKVPLLQAGDGT